MDLSAAAGGTGCCEEVIADGDAIELGCTAGQRGKLIKTSLFFCLLESLPPGRWNAASKGAVDSRAITQKEGR